MTWPRWTCRRLRPRLVDLAAGTLEASARPQVVAHLARCRDCAATATALREVPALLRDDVDTPREDFWLAQRDAIMRRVRDLPTPATHSPQAAPRMLPDVLRRPVLWAPALAAAAIAGIAFVLRAPAPEPVAPHLPVTSIEALDDHALLALRQLAGGTTAPMGSTAATVGPASLVDLSNDELHAMIELVGARE